MYPYKEYSICLSALWIIAVIKHAKTYILRRTQSICQLQSLLYLLNSTDYKETKEEKRFRVYYVIHNFMSKITSV